MKSAYHFLKNTSLKWVGSQIVLGAVADAGKTEVMPVLKMLKEWGGF